MKNPIVEQMEERLVSAGLSRDDAENVATEVKRWLEDPDAKPSKSIHAEGKVVVTGSKNGELLLGIAESANVAGVAAAKEPPTTFIHFPDIIVPHEF